ncbi:MAG: CPBP family intramembrane metalloprotease [Chloroflexi bacterium]|nr:MAG: CPBP family intramembrane metalloprotease [Chloroflexota bacterium]
MSVDAIPRAVTRPIAATHCALLVIGIAAAALLRAVTGGADAAASKPAALVFAAALFVLVRTAGWRADKWRAVDVAVGIGGAALLLGAWLANGGHLWLLAPQHAADLAVWSLVVTAVAVTEEFALRGALFAALVRWNGVSTAVAVTSVVFALIHVPLYGWQAVPLDCAVGVLLGGLRVLTGGVAAPALAHALTDLVAGWVG